MRWAIALLLLATPAFADAQPAAKRAVAKTQPAAKQPCKRRIVGKGLERKVVCEFTAPIIVGARAPKPNVVIAPVDGRRVTGRPKLTDPLAGLPRRRETAR